MTIRSFSVSAAMARRAIVLAVVLVGCDQAPSAPGLVAWRIPPAALVTCTATGPGPSSCPSVSLTFSTYAPGDHFGADFQSDAGSGPSNSITITFSQVVSSVTVTAQDPTFDGNALLAFDAGGAQIASAAIAGNGTPGINVPQRVTVTAAGIKSITLVPAGGDYVAYNGLSFTTESTCATNDAVLDDPAIRQALKNALTQSGAFNNTPETRLETAGYIYQKADGSYDVRVTPPSPSSPSTPCSSTPGGPTPQAGETVIGPFHTHPFAGGDILPKVPGCSPNPRLTYAYDNRRFGGGSQGDWEFIQTPYNGALLPMYIIDKNEVYRLDGATPVRQRSRNPNRFKWNNPSCPW
jgi:hypothetical protein